MQTPAPYPELFTRIAALVAALRVLVHGAVPQLFNAIAKDTRARMAAAAAMLRRYLHLLAADLSLPPLQLTDGLHTGRATKEKPDGKRDRLLRLIEEGAAPHAHSASEGTDPPAVQWAFMVETLRQLCAVLADPARHAKRLAYALRLRQSLCLKPMPLRWHQIRRLPPEVDALLTRLDQAARPQDWAQVWTGIDSS